MKVLPICSQPIKNELLFQVNNQSSNKSVNSSNFVAEFKPAFYMPSFAGTGKSFELNLSEAELKDRTSVEKFIPIQLIDESSEAYKGLAQGDKETLKHLIRAAEYRI